MVEEEGEGVQGSEEKREAMEIELAHIASERTKRQGGVTLVWIAC